MIEYILLVEMFFFTPALDLSVVQAYQSIHYSQAQCEIELVNAIDEWQKKYLKDDEIAEVGIMAQCFEV